MTFQLEDNEMLLLGSGYNKKVKSKTASWTFWNLVAALLGVLAVAMGAYGAHIFAPHDAKYIRVFDTANQYHLFHNLLLAISPYTRRPNTIGFLSTAGIILFSGSCYATALTENMKSGYGAPFGGFCFMGAWFALAF